MPCRPHAARALLAVLAFSTSELEARLGAPYPHPRTPRSRHHRTGHRGRTARCAGVDGATAPGDVTGRPDPSCRQQPFEGGGTGLVRFANATGGYPEEIRQKPAGLLFDDDGLALNIACYNIGGGNAPWVDRIAATQLITPTTGDGTWTSSTPPPAVSWRSAARPRTTATR
ncbi:hypothetical protein ACFVH0_14050 [Streptomyces sp. NPDC127117]|uniref:hypothetical protein n=1 Tax=Streptomyces sp. NPDC127117 TaxID=3345368 RepID=UPI003643C9E1